MANVQAKYSRTPWNIKIKRKINFKMHLEITYVAHFVQFARYYRSKWCIGWAWFVWYVASNKVIIINCTPEISRSFSAVRQLLKMEWFKVDHIYWLINRTLGSITCQTVFLVQCDKNRLVLAYHWVARAVGNTRAKCEVRLNIQYSGNSSFVYNLPICTYAWVFFYQSEVTESLLMTLPVSQLMLRVDAV